MDNTTIKSAGDLDQTALIHCDLDAYKKRRNK